jgi:hypothetical protein
MKKENNNFYYILAKYSIYPGIFILVGLLIFYFYPKGNTTSTISNNTNKQYINIDQSIHITQNNAYKIRSQESQKIIYINNIGINVYIAKTSYQKQVGLMKYTNLSSNTGMLFEFETNTIHTFWMAFTYIPLDMVFISNNFKINQIIKATPCKNNECLIYTPKYNSLYVLELNPKFITDNKIIVGDRVRLF